MAFDITKIGEYLKCPFNILEHLNSCLLFWFLDILFTIIWLIVWIIIFIFIFCPLWLCFTCLCWTVGYFFGGCWNISINDVCPSRKGFFNILENMIQPLYGKFLYRDGGDIDNCYCLPFIKDIFDPLDYFNNAFDSISSISSGGSANSHIVIFVCIIILGILKIGSINQ